MAKSINVNNNVFVVLTKTFSSVKCTFFSIFFFFVPVHVSAEVLGPPKSSHWQSAGCAFRASEYWTFETMIKP